MNIPTLWDILSVWLLSAVVTLAAIGLVVLVVVLL